MGNVRVHGAGGVTSVNGVYGTVVFSGRNYALNSNREIKLPTKAAIDSGNWRNALSALSDDFSVQAGDTVVISVLAKSTNGKTKGLLNLRYSVSSSISTQSIFVLTKEFQRYFFVQTITATQGTPPDGSKPWLFLAAQNGVDDEVTFKDFKVDIGNVATPWSPAPEDIESRLAALEAAAGITHDPPQIEGPEIMGGEDMRE